MDDRTNQRPHGGSPPRRRVLLWMASVVVATVVATGIVLDVNGSDEDSDERGQSASPSAAPAPGSGTGLPVVGGFDARSGWRTPVDPDTRASGDPGFPQVAFAPRSQAVVYLDKDGAVRAVRPGDGRELWAWAPSGLSDYTFNAAVAVVDTSGGDYAVVLSRQESVSVTDGSRKVLTFVDVAPVARPEGSTPLTRRFALGDVDWTMVATPDGVMLGRTGRYGGLSPAVLINPATGVQTPVEPRSTACSQGTCEASTVLPTARGVLTAWQQSSGCDQYGYGTGPTCASGWEVGTSWSSASVAPYGLPVGVPLGVTSQYLVAAWQASTLHLTDYPRVDNTQNTVFAVHDLATGAVVAQITCRSPEGMPMSPGSAQPSTRTSPSGRYLVSGQTVFDLQTRTGRCLTGDGTTRRGIDVWSVDDHGIVYGTIRRDRIPYGALPVLLPEDARGPEQTARFDLARDQVELLPAGTLVPLALAADGSGVFRTGSELGTYPKAPE
ncbi:hypothetical protein LO772_16345 [Yinghuangia sp. ASG 101]|uniref:hypothetical protein n=1 Tax=Yinghuangia sp. ASG 101 TaxID=2896848 RepID=UPI001E463277|nr:hypothetical protein [Yinghuangia sp. ASG 101]UGQ14997.1 hypothetical protein LO772_16345 [Yinghuangia sp. ASG 101]